MDKSINPVFLSQSRLAIVGLLYNTNEVEFSKMKSLLKLTSGNLSTQIQKLYKVEFIEVEKKFKQNINGNFLKKTKPSIIQKLKSKGAISYCDNDDYNPFHK